MREARGRDQQESPLAAAVALAPRIRAAAAATERQRRLSPELVRALAAAGVFRMCVPRALGGGEVDPPAMIETLETIAVADGAAGWSAMIGATSGVASAYLAEQAAREIYGSDPESVSGGAFAPLGKATVVDGGYRVTGRWPFASGCEHCAWLMGGSIVLDGGQPRLLPSGMPDNRLMLFPAAAVRIIDTWDVAGLRGTGSHDIAVDDCFVPAARSLSLISDRPRARGPLYAFPVFGLLALGIAAVALGIARRALDELVALAGAKTPTGSRRFLAERPVIQAEVARAEATLGAARAFLFETVGSAWEGAQAAGAIEIRERARLRLAATHATLASAAAVDIAYGAGGGTAVYAASPLQRCFRDIHVATQHVMVAPATLELAGRILLGLEADTAML
ncbi:MAG TPA: acyl-CoA dehydrogenase family protein [Verrucomicrobiae bacterium]|nr:acyl-CoA dehydrogenase family protein [Verrucomicrobiae bacterium]